jgi:hypothetical protein
MNRPLKITLSSPNLDIHDPLFWLHALFDPTLDSLDKSMTTILHPMHSLMPLHIQMILGNFP